MTDIQRLSHSSWECKYHIVFIPKYRQKRIYGEVRSELRQIFHDLCHRKEGRILEGHLMPDHVHMLVSIPPKYSVSHFVGYLKGKTALHLAQKYGRRRKYRGYSFWARGYFVSTVGANEEVVRRYIRNQEQADKAYDQQSLFTEANFKK
jgi:putative transposase